MQSSNTLSFYTLTVCVGKNVSLTVHSPDYAEHLLVGTVGLTLPDASLKATGFQMQIVSHQLEMEWPGHGRLIIMHSTDTDRGSQHRYDVTWKAFQLKELRDIFHLEGAHWYGVAQIKQQRWPVEKWRMPLVPFIAGDSMKDSQYGGVQERYFLSSQGVAIFVDPAVPLWAAINEKGDRLLKLVSKFQSPFRRASAVEEPLCLQYSIFQAADILATHKLVSNARIDRPTDIPDEQMLRHPIWSTWAVYKRDITQSTVMAFASEIQRHGFKAAQLEIDDDWTPAYGDMVFDTAKFPDAQSMVAELRQLGFRVTLWVHPFASIRSYAVGSGDFWVKSPLTRGFTTWWNGVGKCLDVTNPSAVQWFRSSLRNLVNEVGVASFKFDAGELSWLPRGYTTHAELTTPNDFTRTYAEMCFDVDRDLRALEVRVGIRTQRLPVFVRLMDKESRWDDDNGLATLIPHVLTFGLLGYPFALPDMVGGNAYHGLPERELYIRWLEANTLMPAIQLSIPPWQYDEEVVEIARKMLRLREQYADLIVLLAHESTRTGSPIVRPLWWLAPTDQVAQIIDDEFLLGDCLLVAPVVVRGATSRRVYLPPGRSHIFVVLYDSALLTCTHTVGQSAFVYLTYAFSLTVFIGHRPSGWNAGDGVPPLFSRKGMHY